jgi:hypothetical protein
MSISGYRILPSIFLLAAIGIVTARTGAQSQQSQQEPAREETSGHDVTSQKGYGTHFQTSDRCVACHNGLKTQSGEDISIGINWRSSIMANSGRDPYWMAGVRRELIDHPNSSKLIQDECTICHMPMMRYEAKLAGGTGEAFPHIPPDPGKLGDRLATDGVSCSVCHQITGENLGKRESFVGGFKIDETTVPGKRHENGPFEIDKAHTTIMRSSSTFEPIENSKVIRSSELCATCHTLFTKALNRQGDVVGELPEQMPYQEWLHSDYKGVRSCQSCHMPVVQEDVAITSVFGQPRSGFSRHIFVGGNFFMQRLLNLYRSELGVPALPQEMDSAANRTIANLQSESAKLAIKNLEVRNGHVEAEIAVENMGGHKLPTAYPSRRVWLHVTVRDAYGKAVFESGKLNPNGSIEGNDNDEDATRFEPHYSEITRPDQVQIYESVMSDPNGKPTTALLTAIGYLKDNRLLPHGFDKATAEKEIAVRGDAEKDESFKAGGHAIRYSVAFGDAQGPFQMEAELWYQPIAFRWAMNLKPYDAMETKRFVNYYESMASGSGVMLAHSTGTTKSN